MLSAELNSPYVHATALVVGEAGVLITGASGAGKSSLALALLDLGARAGAFARLIGDDRVGLTRESGRLIAFCHQSIEGKIERRGQGVVDFPFIERAVVRFVIALHGKNTPPPPRYPGETDPCITLAGVRMPALSLRQEAAVADLAAEVWANPRLQRSIAGESD